MNPSDIERIRKAVEEVIAAMLSIPEADATFPKSWFPAAACEQASIAIAGVLADRGLGDWTFVQATQDGEMGGHAWLELRDEGGLALFTIDSTIEQFADLATGPHIGPAPTPAAQRFTNVRYAGPYQEWRFLGTEKQPFLTNLRQVRAILSGRTYDGREIS